MNWMKFRLCAALDKFAQCSRNSMIFDLMPERDHFKNTNGPRKEDRQFPRKLVIQ
jgi:hypothetical protein